MTHVASEAEANAVVRVDHVGVGGRTIVEVWLQRRLSSFLRYRLEGGKTLRAEAEVRGSNMFSDGDQLGLVHAHLPLAAGQYIQVMAICRARREDPAGLWVQSHSSCWPVRTPKSGAILVKAVTTHVEWVEALIQSGSAAAVVVASGRKEAGRLLVDLTLTGPTADDTPALDRTIPLVGQMDSLLAPSCPVEPSVPPSRPVRFASRKKGS